MIMPAKRAGGCIDLSPAPGIATIFEDSGHVTAILVFPGRETGANAMKGRISPARGCPYCGRTCPGFSVHVSLVALLLLPAPPPHAGADEWRREHEPRL